MFSPPSPRSVAQIEKIGNDLSVVLEQLIMLLTVPDNEEDMVRRLVELLPPVPDNKEDMESMWSSFMLGSYGAMFTSLACEDKDIEPFVLPMFKASFSLSVAVLIKSFPSDKTFINQVTFTCLFNIGYSLWEEGLNRNIPHIIINTALLFFPDFVKNNPILTGFSLNIHSVPKLLYNINEYVMSGFSYIEEKLEVQLSRILFNDLDIYE